MSTSITLPWQDPLALVPAFEQSGCAALLYSGQPHTSKHSYSYIGIGAEEILRGSDLARLKSKKDKSNAWYEDFWIGWLGYGLKNQLEALPADKQSHIQPDDYFFFKPKSLYRFHHADKTVECIGEHVLQPYWKSAPSRPEDKVKVSLLESNMTTREYLSHVQTILENINAGQCYQANLTRKFYGYFKNPPCPSSLFLNLCAQSPASYSAFIKADDISVISSSPELFLDISPSGRMISQPIKGTIARHEDPKLDEIQKQKLSQSPKDRAENLMIVDLMRNDFSKICTTNSVKVDALFDITSHRYIHHMSSRISGQVRPDTHPIDAISACFPPGSMTGAPKIKAMQLCSQLEGQARGIYSGALGWLSGNGSAQLSVVIRTLIIERQKFEFQVGGGIVADSNALAELKETLDKAKALCAVLGIPLSQLKNL